MAASRKPAHRTQEKRPKRKVCKDCYRPEIWTSIPEYSVYEISSHGNVRSVGRVTKNGRRLKPQSMALVMPTNRCYLQVALRNDEGKQKMHTVHRLLLESFVGPSNGLLGLHWDDDPTHNHLDNLRWGTLLDNIEDCIRNGNHPEKSRDRCKAGHLLTAPNLVESHPTRRCRACRNAASYKRIHPEANLEDEANRYYERYKGAFV